MRTLLASLGLTVLLSGTAIGQLCPCDCNQDRNVRIGELTTSVNIALDYMSVDECNAADRDQDSDVQVAELIAGVDAALRGCSESIAGEVSEARNRWNALGLSHYEYRFQVGCFCPGPHNVILEVLDNEIVAIRDPDSGATITPQFTENYKTVDELFDLIESAIPVAHRVDVEFDPARGFPTTVSIDYHAQIADDEMWFSISDLSAMEGSNCSTGNDCDPFAGVCIEPGGSVGCGVCFDHVPDCSFVGEDCTFGEVCKPVGIASCACDPSVLQCQTGCTSDVQCDVGRVCDFPSSHRCVPIRCNSDGSCPANFACIFPPESRTGSCLRRTCASDTDCASDSGFCVNGNCHPRPGTCRLLPP